MVERIARAMMKQDALDSTADGPGIHHGEWRAYEGMAIAAIKAMREPNVEMVAAAEEKRWLGAIDYGPSIKFAPDPIDTWRVMIDSALKSAP